MKIAIIQFPGMNCEYETKRAVVEAGMEARIIRWNEMPEKFLDYDGYVLPGGFSYEDRGRAGIISALDPVMKVVAGEAAKGKPVIGICNGAQALVETGLAPGLKNNKLGMALGLNEWMQGRELKGFGFYNNRLKIKNTAKPGRSAFNRLVDAEAPYKIPVANGEGRFLMEEDLWQELKANDQIVFSYTDDYGKIQEDYPYNVSHSQHGAAAICNASGNVMAIMPHPERRSSLSELIFKSMAEFIQEGNPAKDSKIKYEPREYKIKEEDLKDNNIHILVDLIITDNEAQTLENAIHLMGFKKAKLSKRIHWEIDFQTDFDLEKLTRDLILSGELLNVNKETAQAKIAGSWQVFDPQTGFTPKQPDFSGSTIYSVSLKDDFLGKAKENTLVQRLGFKDVRDVKKSVWWILKSPEKDQRKIIDSNIFFNQFGQDCYKIKEL